MPHVLIAGCGYVGTAAAARFGKQGWQVTGWTRTAAASAEPSIESRAVDLTDSEAVLRNAFGADLVVHCASSGGGGADAYRAVYRAGVANLARAFPGARLLFTSSTSVYAQADGRWVNEDSPAEPETDTGKILREAEDIVLSQGGMVLRLGGIYGPGRSALLRALRLGTASISDPDYFVNQAHRDDIASAILVLAAAPQIPSLSVCNVIDDAPALRSEILQWLSRRLNIPLANAAKGGIRRRGESNKRVSNARLRAHGWIPQFPSYRDGLERSVLPALENTIP